ncbi:MAG: ABC transporter ATP-binding protein [Desulfobacterales bacterium]|jgi:branched-chain amino acid transport system ATP-binding protein
MLNVHEISVRYNTISVLQDVSFSVQKGQFVAVVGANSAGKTTILRTVSGLVRPYKGSIEFCNEPIQDVQAYEIAAKGIAHVPEGRRIFDKLTIEENLLVGAHTRNDSEEVMQTLAQMYHLFPILKDRRNKKGETLSGGERQQLAIARGLMAKPQLLMLDEPSLGLSPILSNKVIHTCEEIRKTGTTILIVEQKVSEVLKLVDKGYVLQRGRIVMEGNGKDLLESDMIRKAYLGL